VFDPTALVETLRRNGLASYKIPTRLIEVTEFPRISDNKIDKKDLLRLEQSA
jgi:non-ribosomal peptide synthetase component E (peptide arylation enzyme)